jgi:hypothetical protein
MFGYSWFAYKVATVFNRLKVKVKVTRYVQFIDTLRERRYSTYSFLTLALEGGE